MTPQSTIMIHAIIRQGQIDKLRALLATMNKVPGHADPENRLIPFGQLDRLHMSRFVILETHTADEIEEFGKKPRSWPPSLAFICDVDGDGDTDSFLEELVDKAGSGLKEVFSHCDGYPECNSDILEWMKQQNIQKPQANYVNWIGRTVTQVHEEDALHKSLAKYLLEIVDEVGRDDCRALRQRLLSHVEMEKHKGHLKLTPPKRTPFCWKVCNFMHLIGVPLVLLAFLPLFLLFLPVYLIRLRMLERSDPIFFERPDPSYVKELSSIEDWSFTNQFNVFGDIKPGLTRLFTLRLSLILLNYACRHVYNRGFLTRVRTIHFARWVILDNYKRIYFASNYDGSQSSYMDDFINKVAWGLNLVFSNAVAYPPTKWLIFGGAKHEQNYKYTLRRHQLPSVIWYKAYPDLTAYDLSRNILIRKGVEVRQSNDAEIREWLSLI